VVLLAAQCSPGALRDFARCVGPCSLSDISDGRLSELRGAALDRLLLGADGERRHPPVLESEHPTIPDHLADYPKRLLRRHLSGCLLQRDRV
jgi:hypothetical protein